MENQVIFRAYQDVEPDDLNNIGDYARQSLDHVVGDAVSDTRGYAGFAAVKASATKVTVAPGRFYRQGEVYNRSSSVDFDFAVTLPVTGRKFVLVLVSGQTIDTDEVARNFLVDTATQETQARPVPMRRAREATVNVMAGQEAPAPTDPIYDAGYLAVARIVLAPTGVESVDNLEETRLPSVKKLAGNVAELTTARAADHGKIVALDSNIAALTAKSANNVDVTAYGRSLVRLADIEAKIGIPSDALDSAANYFLTSEGSDLANASSNCLVQEGIRFADAAAWSGPFTVFNPNNTVSVMRGGTIFPAYTRELRQRVGPQTGELQVNAFTYQEQELRQLTRTRRRVRYGEPYTVCTNSGWWGAITDQYIPETFSHDGELFQTLSVDWDGPTHGWVRVQQYWYDTYEEPYWEAITVDHVVPGYQIAQTIPVTNDMWLDGIGLTFTRLAAEGDVTLAICEVALGQPDLSRVLSVTNVARATLKLKSETVVGIDPVFLRGGRQYALVVITSANHWLATTSGSNYPQGTFFTIFNGGYQQGDGTRDLCFALYAAKFSAVRATVELNQLQLVGGVSAIDILADMTVPDSTGLDFEVLIAGNWLPLGRGGSVLRSGGALPPLVPIRAVFTGTPDVMPSLRIDNSTVKISRQRLAFTHVSAERSLPGGGSNQIRVIHRMEYFDAAHHTHGVKLLTGAGFATVVNPNAVTDELADDAIVRTFVFNLPAAVTAFKKRTDGATDSEARPWHVGFDKDYAL